MRRMLSPMSVMMSMSGGMETTSAPCGETKFDTTPRIWSASAYESRMTLVIGCSFAGVPDSGSV